ncbi:MAG: pyruvate formate lyase family protein [bacterium]|nr:pyruvate formate lyase family protein [bacterium]
MRQVTRKSFIAGAASLAATPLWASGGKPPPRAGRPPAYDALRAELRAFYPPGYCREACQSKEQVASCAAIGRELDAWAAAHHGFDALDIRRESYLAMRRHFLPFLFANSPFYFEAGVNGGWSGARPARHVNRICGRFYREQGLIPQAAWDLLSARSRENLTLCCGPFVDDMHHVPPMRTIIRKGFRGVRDAVAAALAACPKDDPLGRKELETALVGLDTVHAIQLKFAEEAERRLKTVGAGEERTRLLRIAASARRCPWEPPQTFFEALNTLWFVREILGYVDGVNIFALGRPDAWFIDLYRRDLADGRLTEAEARDLVARFLIVADCHEADSAPVDSYDDQEAEIPLTLGGCDEKGAFVYNELTRMFLDAHLACGCVYPKLHVRVDVNSPQAYLDHIGRQLMAGHAVFTVFNDRRLVRQFLDEGFVPEDARNYIGCGCWNGYIDSWQDVDSANYVSLVKILALTIHRDPEVERRCGLVLDPIDGARSFEELRDTVYRNYMRFFRSLMSEYTRYGRTSAKVFPHPVYTMCLEGGVESRRDTTDGGITGRQRPKEITLGFVGNVVDSLCAIDQVCFRDRVCTVREFLDAVRANWKGEKNQRLRMLAMNAPYWGDNSDRSTSLMAWFMKRTHEDVDGFATDQGGAYRLAIFTYREFMYWGRQTKATPDGRYDGDYLAQGFSPSEFRCKEGATAVMNAIGRLPNECLYQCNANLTFDASAMTPALMGAVLRVFAEKGSHLMQPNCNSVEQLLDAQKHPERHQHLIVRVCGFSARFVSLSKRWQDEVIARHRLK